MLNMSECNIACYRGINGLVIVFNQVCWVSINFCSLSKTVYIDMISEICYFFTECGSLANVDKQYDFCSFACVHARIQTSCLYMPVYICSCSLVFVRSYPVLMYQQCVTSH